MRPIFSLTRYMTTDKYISTLEDALLQITEDKMRNYVTFMERQARAAVKKLGEYAMRCTGIVPLRTQTPCWLHPSACCVCAAVLPHCVAETTTATIVETVRSAADSGFTGRQLLEASVKTLSSAGQTGLPDESPEERRLRLLVSC
jgi:hypothetical protein